MDKLTQAERVKIDYTIVKGATDRHTQEYQERVAERRSFHDIFGTQRRSRPRPRLWKKKPPRRRTLNRCSLT